MGGGGLRVLCESYFTKLSEPEKLPALQNVAQSLKFGVKVTKKMSETPWTQAGAF